MSGEADLATHDPGPRPQRPAGRLRGLVAGRETSLAVYLWSQIVLLLWWAGQFPGLLSYDSTVYVTHVTIGPWTADHSVLYDWFVLLSIDLNRSVWVLTLLQTVAWSAALAYFVRSLQMFGVRGRWAAIPAVILPCLPTFGSVASTVWKDSAFALTAMLLAASLLRLLALWETPQRTPWLRGRRTARAEAVPACAAQHDVTAPDAAPPMRATSGARAPGSAQRTPWRLLVVILLEYVGLLLFRLDGFLMLIPITIVLLIAMRGLRWKLLGAAVLAFLAMVVANDVVYPAAHIKAPMSSLSYGTFYADISVVYRNHPDAFTAADKATMAKVAKLKQWRKGGNCYNSDTLTVPSKFNLTAADTYRKQLATVWFDALKREPLSMIKSRVCRGAIAWNPFPPPRDRSTTVIAPSVVPQNYYHRIDRIPPDLARNLRPDPLVSGLGSAAHALRVDLTSDFWLTVIWRGATWCYLAYLALILAARRARNWRLLAAGAIPLGNQLMVLADNPAQLYRYMVAALIVGILLLPMVAVPRGPKVRSVPDVPGGSDIPRESSAPSESDVPSGS